MWKRGMRPRFLALGKRLRRTSFTWEAVPFPSSLPGRWRATQSSWVGYCVCAACRRESGPTDRHSTWSVDLSSELGECHCITRIHRRTRMDGERTAEGVRELQGRWPGLHWGDRNRRTVFSRRKGPLWPSAGAAMSGMAREYAAGNSRGPGWREFAGTLGQLQAGRQVEIGMTRSRTMAPVNWVSQGQRRGRCRVRRRAERVI